MINHNFKKKFGQNFITDKNLLSAIVDDAEIDKNDEVLEIGAGAGTLTKEISNRAKKVISYEIDKDLESYLLGLKLNNVNFIFKDIMKENLLEIENYFEDGYKIIANLPYYITTPIIFKFLKNSKKLKSLTIMVQKEVAERIVATKGEKDYGILTIMINFYGNAKITRNVNRKMFYPEPNVDSAVVRIDIDREKYKNIDDDKFYSFVQSCFSMRRKTLKNNLEHSNLKLKMKIDNLPQSILSLRAENLSFDDFVNIYLKIFE